MCVCSCAGTDLGALPASDFQGCGEGDHGRFNGVGGRKRAIRFVFLKITCASGRRAWQMAGGDLGEVKGRGQGGGAGGSLEVRMGSQGWIRASRGCRAHNIADDWVPMVAWLAPMTGPCRCVKWLLDGTAEGTGVEGNSGVWLRCAASGTQKASAVRLEAWTCLLSSAFPHLQDEGGRETGSGPVSWAWP